MDALPHFLPYALYVALGAAQDVVPDVLRPALDPLRAVLVAASLVVFWRRGAYADLAHRATVARCAPGLAVAAGLVVAAIWMPLAEAPAHIPLLDAVPSLGSRGGFDADAWGAGAAWGLIAGRLVAFVLVIPLAEELFVRSLVPRFVDAGDGDWRKLPIGRYTVVSGGVSLGLFTLTHPEWLAALVTGALWMLLLRHTGRLRDAVLSHMVANGALAVYVLASGDTRWW